MATENKSSAGLSKSCILIIVVAGVERFAYKGVASNLVTYLTDVVKLSTSSAVKCVSSWSGVTSMLPLVTAVLVDSYWDRYSTIVASSLLYVVGLMGLTSWTILYVWMPTSSLFLPLYLISLGQGAYNPSLQAFGAEQLETDEDHHLSCDKENERRPNNNKSSFFQWWYFGICSGSLLGNSIMSYIQDIFGWELGFAIPTIVMSFSVVCFIYGSPFYLHKQQKCGHHRPNDSVSRALTASRKIRLPSREADDVELELQEKKPFQDDFSVSKNLDINFTIPDEPPGVTRVILRLLPVWLMLLMFAVIFQQPITFFTKQGMAMKHTIGTSFVIPPAMLQSSITVTIIALMPLYDKLIIPVLRLMTRNDKGINVLQRIGIGMFLSIIAMIVAAVVESKRLEITRRGEQPGSKELRIELSIFWLLPQYILLGISDVFTVVGMQEFFYMQVPSTMRTIGISLYLSVFGVGSFLSALLISIIEMVTGACGKEHSWFSDNMSEARLDNYYWFLAFLSSISFLVYANLCRYYGDCNGLSNGSHK